MSARERHALTRTSPKGGPFIGTCIKCGIKGITLAEVGRSECVNPAGFTADETLLAAIEGHDHEG